MGETIKCFSAYTIQYYPSVSMVGSSDPKLANTSSHNKKPAVDLHSKKTRPAAISQGAVDNPVDTPAISAMLVTAGWRPRNPKCGQNHAENGLTRQRIIKA